MSWIANQDVEKIMISVNIDYLFFFIHAFFKRYTRKFDIKRCSQRLK